MKCEMCQEEVEGEYHNIKIDENGDFLTICESCYMGTQE